MFGSNCNEEATLYYLYMMADGNVSYSEEKIFDEICKELNLDTDEKNSVIEKCKGFAANETDVFSIVVREKIDEQVGQGWLGFGLRDASSLARIIWNLVNLGYADSSYSDEEKKIVNYLVAKWSVSTEIYQELVDIAETMLALTKQRGWIASIFSKDSIRDKKERKVDSEIKHLLEDVNLTIQELTM